MRELHICTLCICILFLFFLSKWLIIRVQPLWFIVYVWLVIKLILPSTDLLVSLTVEHWHCYLALLCHVVATKLLGIPSWSLLSWFCANTCVTQDMFCYHEPNNYSSCLELKYWVMIINLSPNYLLSSQLHLLDAMTLSP